MRSFRKLGQWRSSRRRLDDLESRLAVSVAESRQLAHRLDEILDESVPRLLLASEGQQARLNAIAVQRALETSLAVSRGQAEAAVAAQAETILAVAREHAEAAVAAQAEAALAAAREHAEAASEAAATVVGEQALAAVARSSKEVQLRIVELGDEISFLRNTVMDRPSERSGRRSKADGRKALVSLGFGAHVGLLEATRPVRERYAELHGYELVEETPSAGADRPGGWPKIPLLQSALERFETVVWVDADAVICDVATDIADDAVGGFLLHLVSHRYAGQCFPNLGVMVLRQHQWTADFLAAVWDKKEYLDHPWWENAAALDLLGYRVEEPVVKVRPTEYDRFVGELPQRWNMIPQVGGRFPGIVHLPGYSNEVRRQLIGRLVADPSCADIVLADPMGSLTVPNAVERALG